MEHAIMKHTSAYLYHPLLRASYTQIQTDHQHIIWYPYSFQLQQASLKQHFPWLLGRCRSRARTGALLQDCCHFLTPKDKNVGKLTHHCHSIIQKHAAGLVLYHLFELSNRPHSILLAKVFLKLDPQPSNISSCFPTLGISVNLLGTQIPKSRFSSAFSWQKNVRTDGCKAMMPKIHNHSNVHINGACSAVSLWRKYDKPSGFCRALFSEKPIGTLLNSWSECTWWSCKHQKCVSKGCEVHGRQLQLRGRTDRKSVV